MLTPSSRAILLSKDVKVGGLGFKIEPLNPPWKAHYFSISPSALDTHQDSGTTEGTLPHCDTVLLQEDGDDDPCICFSREAQ